MPYKKAGRQDGKYPQTKINGKMLLVHRVRAENALGCPLPLGSEVHHVNEQKGDPLGPLVICQDHAYHMALHARLNVLRAGGDPFLDKICHRCRVPKPRADFYNKSNLCPPCARMHAKEANRRAKVRRLGLPIDWTPKPLGRPKAEQRTV